jgi:hypothetical protein
VADRYHYDKDGKFTGSTSDDPPHYSESGRDEIGCLHFVFWTIIGVVTIVAHNLIFVQYIPNYSGIATAVFCLAFMALLSIPFNWLEK